MFKYQCHKTYLHDFSRRGGIHLVRGLTEAEADAMLAASSYVKRDEEGRIPPHGLLLNKGFCVVARVGDRCQIVNDHDGNHTLWDGDWDFFSTYLGLCPPRA